MDAIRGRRELEHTAPEEITEAALNKTVLVGAGTVAESRLYGFSRAAELDDLWNRQLRDFWRFK